MKLNTSSRRHACTVIALYLLAVLLLAIPMTVAKYESSASGSDTAVIARYDVGMTENVQSISLDTLFPGYSKTFTVNLVNNSDVSVSYKVDYVTEGNLPLDITVTEGNGTLGYDNNKTAEVTVTVEWPSADDNPKYADMVDSLRIVVDFAQID